ncbi:MAG: hypothetical protein U9Q63_03205, partial [Patescibacteria group bacterium]|nr:hypothetical protein [Patescibacteria group bacterium]
RIHKQSKEVRNMAGVAAIYATYARRVLVGGLLVEMDPDKFIPLIDSKTTVIHGVLGKLKKYHLYFIVRDGLTMYCKTMSPLSITPSIEVEKIDTGGVIKL